MGTLTFAVGLDDRRSGPEVDLSFLVRGCPCNPLFGILLSWRLRSEKNSQSCPAHTGRIEPPYFFFNLQLRMEQTPGRLQDR